MSKGTYPKQIVQENLGAQLWEVWVALRSMIGFTIIIVSIVLVVTMILSIIDVVMLIPLDQDCFLILHSEWCLTIAAACQRPHCGLDDSKNIARLVAELLRQGLVADVSPKHSPCWLMCLMGNSWKSLLIDWGFVGNKCSANEIECIHIHRQKDRQTDR